MAITLQDVAKQAGVSMKTVSRVVNNEQDVSDNTRQHVLKIIEQVGYVPHVQAQRLASGKTRSITLHYPLANPALISNQLEMSFITGTAMGAAEGDYYFSLMTNQLTRTDLLGVCRGAQADGLILMQIAVQDWRANLLRENNYPFVMIGHCHDNEGLSYIDLDFENAIVEAYAHLVSLGHEHIGFLTYPESWRKEGLGPAVRALPGLESAANKFNVDPVLYENDLNIKSVYDTVTDMSRKNPQLTAFVAMHTIIAVGAIRALQDMGHNVPDDYSIIGVAFGQESELVIPPLTAINFSGHEIGYQAAQMLIRQLSVDNLAPEQVLVPPKLEVRSSTALVSR